VGNRTRVQVVKNKVGPVQAGPSSTSCNVIGHLARGLADRTVGRRAEPHPHSCAWSNLTKVVRTRLARARRLGAASCIPSLFRRRDREADSSRTRCRSVQRSCSGPDLPRPSTSYVGRPGRAADARWEGWAPLPRRKHSDHATTRGTRPPPSEPAGPTTPPQSNDADRSDRAGPRNLLRASSRSAHDSGRTAVALKQRGKSTTRPPPGPVERPWSR